MVIVLGVSDWRRGGEGMISCRKSNITCECAKSKFPSRPREYGAHIENTGQQKALIRKA